MIWWVNWDHLLWVLRSKYCIIRIHTHAYCVRDRVFTILSSSLQLLLWGFGFLDPTRRWKICPNLSWDSAIQVVGFSSIHFPSSWLTFATDSCHISFLPARQTNTYIRAWRWHQMHERPTKRVLVPLYCTAELLIMQLWFALKSRKQKSRIWVKGVTLGPVPLKGEICQVLGHKSPFTVTRSLFGVPQPIKLRSLWNHQRRLFLMKSLYYQVVTFFYFWRPLWLISQIAFGIGIMGVSSAPSPQDTSTVGNRQPLAYGKRRSRRPGAMLLVRINQIFLLTLVMTGCSVLSTVSIGTWDRKSVV